MAGKVSTLSQRFWRHVKKTDYCWIWTASCRKGGHGQIAVGKTMMDAHIVSWMLAKGKLPTNRLLFKCNNPICVNPDHLFEGTSMDNVQDMAVKGKKKCARGESHGSAKLAYSQITEIRLLYANGIRAKDIWGTGRYPVTYGCIQRITSNQTWR